MSLEQPPVKPVIRSVAVIGAGDRGRAFALRCAAAGFTVVLEDVMPSRLRVAEEQIATAPERLQTRVQLASTVEDAVREADLAIDFVPDELESKLEIFSMLDRMAPPRTILCTPTKALSVSDLASCTYRPGLCVALDLAEGDLATGSVGLIRGRDTTADTVTQVSDWLSRLGVVAELLQDTRDPMLVKNVAQDSEY